MSVFYEPPNHVGAHPSETDHSELHDERIVRVSVVGVGSAGNKNPRQPLPSRAIRSASLAASVSRRFRS
jgi:hypothetical protein